MVSFNESQVRAVMHMDGPMLVLAGPGCGKTAVITGRIKNLIEMGVSPSSILVVTFTRSAAAEMKERFLQLEQNNGEKVNFGTLHGIFYYILRRECRLPADSIIGEEKKNILLKEILESFCQDDFLQQELMSNVAKEISYVKGNGIASKNFYSTALPAETFRKVFAEYRRWLKENRKLDFDDINTAAFQLLKTNADALKRWQKQFSYILVDEFQDINPLQYRIVQMLAEPEKNLFIVGDDDQSIYRFRGSNPDIMLSFPKQYDGCEIVRLSQNYRSTPQILRAAGRVIRDNKKRYAKELFTEKKAGDAVSVCIFQDVWKETDALSFNIRKEVKSGTSYGEIAVLVRTNFGARAAIEKLISDRIPFEAQQEIPCIFDHFMAKDLMAYLQIASGSTKREDFVRICNKPNRFISRDAFFEKKVNFESLFIYYEDRQWMWQRIEEFEQDVHAIAQLPPYGAINYIRKVIGYDQYIREYAAEKRLPYEELFGLLDEIMESARPFKNLQDWAEHIAQYREKVKKDKCPISNSNSVKITTLHASKGKEYDIVYILDVNEGVIPFHKASLEQDLEEERRLFYVGMTRARKRLNIYAVKERFEKKMIPSSFLKNLIPIEEKEK